MRLNNYLLAAAVGLALTLPSIGAADASPVNYMLSVTATSGPLNGTTASGTFSYDTNSIVPGGFNANAGLLTALNFTWDRITYNQTTANTGTLGFDATGMLISSLFGNACIAGDCGVVTGQELWFVDIPGFLSNFAYTVSGVQGIFSGTVTESLVVPAPLIGHGLPVLLAVGGILFGAKFLERGKKRRLLEATIPHAAAWDTTILSDRSLGIGPGGFNVAAVPDIR
jgi:hypothetical protein